MVLKRGWGYTLAVALAAMLAGCAHPRPPVKYAEGRECVVELPAVRLNNQESIQAFELAIGSGRLSAILGFFDDWDLEVVWDHPDRLLVRGQARHFPAGLRDATHLSNLFTVQVCDAAGFSVTATLVTETATSADVPEVASRTIRIPTGEVGGWRRSVTGERHYVDQGDRAIS
ncbi:MAG: hypothetical protein M5U12_21475 [Verrucomicrobia bacterium]|nr:hypothetical protein [Verrucomicrobiota bacterium]